MRDISLHLMDIIQNSVAAGSEKIKIQIHVDIVKNELLLQIEDDGSGMSEDFLKSVGDPFKTTRKSRRIGLGIPMLKDSCECSDGRFFISSKIGLGTKVFAVFGKIHIDRPPLGSISETVVATIMSYPNLDIELLLGVEDKEFVLSTKAIKEQLKDIMINRNEVIHWIKGYIDEGVINILGGVLDEVDCRT